MKVKAGLMIDLGNSETRYGVLVNNVYRTNTLSNSWGPGGKDYVIPDEYANNKSTVMVLHTENGDMRYAHGKIVAREFPFDAVTPNAQSKKLTQDVNKLSLQMVFYSALKDIAKEVLQSIDNIEVTFSVALLLPPEEQQHDSKTAVEYLKNMDSVEIKHPVDAVYKFEVDNVRIVPEGLAAFFAVCFEEKDGGLVERAENETFLTGQTLIVDIGAGTTDFIRVEDCELITSSRATFQKGGNTVEAYLKRVFKTEYNITKPNMERVITEGILEAGVDEIDVTEHVKKAKLTYTKNLNNDIITYIEGQAMDIKTIKGILLTGGGSMPTLDKDGNVKVPAMSDLLIAYIKNVAPQLKTLDTLGLNPRFMNLEGLKLLYKYA